MQFKKLRIPVAMICGLFLILFGVFLFSDFIYQGQTLKNNIFPLLNSVNNFANGIYELFIFSFTVNFFQSFAGVTSNPSAVYAIITGFYDVACSSNLDFRWFFGGGYLERIEKESYNRSGSFRYCSVINFDL